MADTSAELSVMMELLNSHHLLLMQSFCEPFLHEPSLLIVSLISVSSQLLFLALFPYMILFFPVHFLSCLSFIHILVLSFIHIFIHP